MIVPPEIVQHMVSFVAFDDVFIGEVLSLNKRVFVYMRDNYVFFVENWGDICYLDKWQLVKVKLTSKMPGYMICAAICCVKLLYLDVSCCKYLCDDHFRYLNSVQILDISGCNQEDITNDAFKHLKSVHTLNISGCHQDSITSDVFKYLKNVNNLDVSFTNLLITTKAVGYLCDSHLI